MNPVIVIGIGGIGSHLVEPLARYLSTLDQAPEFVLVDGDGYSRDNRGRQRLGASDVGLNKAAAHARRLTQLLPELPIRAIEQYVSERNAQEMIPEGSLVLACPDNHATRLIVSRRCQRLRNATAIFAGNELTDGAVQVYVRRGGRELFPPPERFHPEIAQPHDRNPADLSCEELARRTGGGQTLCANLMAASLALNAARLVLERKPLTYGEVFFDIDRNRSIPRERR